MGIGPVPAIKMALERAGLALSEIDLVEVNEAFACQYLAVEKELGLDRKKVNVNGGAIAIGHPLGATGTRLTTTLVYDLKKTQRGLRGWQRLHRRRPGRSRWFWKESDFSFAIVPGVYCARACEVKKPHESLRCRGWSRYALLSV